MAAARRDKSEAFRLAHRFLVDRERRGSTFTLDELAATASWKKSSARTNLGKKLKELVAKTAAGYKVAGVAAYSEDEFARLMSQRQAVSADPKKPRLPPSVEVLVLKARESALLALQIYNNPTTSFRTEGYAVLMVIAWTALLHAIFEKRGVDYFHKDREGKPVTVDGDSKAWELARCLKEFYGGTACAVRSNLDLMTGLRNRVEQRYAPGIDPHVAGECQAMLFNFDEMMTSEFGSYFALRESLAVPLQTSTVRHVEQARAMKAVQTRHFDEIKSFVDTFRNTQPDAILQDPHFRFRVYLVPKVGTASSSDMAF